MGLWSLFFNQKIMITVIEKAILPKHGDSFFKHSIIDGIYTFQRIQIFCDYDERIIDILLLYYIYNNQIVRNTLKDNEMR